MDPAAAEAAGTARTTVRAGVQEQPSGLRATGVVKRFGATIALDGAELAAARGEVHALVGENGAGKSTLIRILSGVLQSDAGSVELDGRPIPSRSKARTALVRTAFQELSLVPALSVAENLLFDDLPTGWHRRLRRRELWRRSEAVMAALGGRYLDPRGRVEDLPLADRQVLEVMKCIASGADVLVLDEPTSSLGKTDADWVLGQARRCAADGRVVLFVSHRLQEVRDVVDRITVLRNGRTVLTCAPHEASDDRLITAMLGRRMDHLYPPRGQEPTGTLLSVKDLEVPGKVGPVSFEVRRGELLGLFALPGQGQHELLQALAGALPWKGELSLNGQPYACRSPHRAATQGVVLVPEDRQRDALFLEHSTLSNMTVGALGKLRGPLRLINQGVELSQAKQQAQRVGLDVNRLGDPVTGLSGGNQQKTVLARALLAEPSLLLLDDCTRGVDVGTKAEIFDLLRVLCQAGISALFHSSDISEVVHVADRVVVIARGRIAGTVTADGLSEERVLGLALGVGAAAS